MDRAVQDQRRRHVTYAVRAAWRRVTELDPDDDGQVFAAIGELLFWITAATDTVAWSKPLRGSKDLVDSLRFARDLVTHGRAPWAAQVEFGDFYGDTYTDRYGNFVWTKAEPERPQDRPRADLFAKTLTGHTVLDTTRTAIKALGLWSD